MSYVIFSLADIQVYVHSCWQSSCFGCKQEKTWCEQTCSINSFSYYKEWVKSRCSCGWKHTRHQTGSLICRFFKDCWISLSIGVTLKWERRLFMEGRIWHHWVVWSFLHLLHKWPWVWFPGVTSKPCFWFVPFHGALSSFKYPYNRALMERGCGGDVYSGNPRFVSQMITISGLSCGRIRALYLLPIPSWKFKVSWL